MATQFLIQRTSPKYLSQFLRPFQPLFNSSSGGRGRCRGVASQSNTTLHNNDEAGEASASALGVDKRVPATVITGFLGSGKARSLCPF